MILIVPDELEAGMQLNGTDQKFLEDKVVYREFIHLYEKNFKKWIAATNQMENYNELLEKQSSVGVYSPAGNLLMVEIRKLKSKFDIVRPYFYKRGDKYYFFRSTIRGLSEANIFELEPTDILMYLEKSFIDFSFTEKIKRSSSKISFDTTLQGTFRTVYRLVDALTGEVLVQENGCWEEDCGRDITSADLRFKEQVKSFEQTRQLCMTNQPRMYKLFSIVGFLVSAGLVCLIVRELFRFPVSYMVCAADYSDCFVAAKFDDMSSCQSWVERGGWYCDSTDSSNIQCVDADSEIAFAVCVEQVIVLNMTIVVSLLGLGILYFLYRIETAIVEGSSTLTSALSSSRGRKNMGSIPDQIDDLRQEIAGIAQHRDG